MPMSPIPDKLFGEDRNFGDGLFVDLVPRSGWFTNLRSCVTEGDWKRIHDMVVQRAGNQCEICGSPPDPKRRLWMEAHERWDFDNFLRTQTLKRLICLCSSCHLATHFGYAKTQHRDQEALAQLMRVNSFSAEKAVRHINHAFKVWERRSQIDWNLDLSMLVGVVPVRYPPSAEERRRQAEERAQEKRREEGSS